ncbi:hypothetical protein B0H14DRAFT_3171461 [Mycena olivaceomarginata]|nr:hypothetical protein B0H14DRAFT_3171461 [Mycena olivaceomarginata]
MYVHLLRNYLFSHKPPPTTRPVTRALHREHGASEHFPPEHQIIPSSEPFRVARSLYAHTARSLFLPTFPFYPSTTFLGPTGLPSAAPVHPSTRTSDPTFCLPAPNSVLRQWSPPRGKVLPSNLLWVICVVQTLQLPIPSFLSLFLVHTMRPTSSASSTSRLPRHVAPRLMFASEPIPTSPRPHRVSELEVADHSISPYATRRRSPPRALEQPPKPRSFLLSTMSPHPRHVTPRGTLASEPSFTSPGERRVSELDRPITPHVDQRRSAPIEPELARDPAPKPRSRRCFVCGTTGRHPLDFRVCPRTAVLLRRSLAKINEDGRLVSIDGSPLPMTRHPGGVAAHLISRICNPTRFIPEPSNFSPAPIVQLPPRPVSTELRNDDSSSPSREFNSRSPHVIPPVDRAEPEPEHVPLAQIPHPSPSFDRARATILLVLLESMLDVAFRSQLRAILILIERLNASDPSTLRELTRALHREHGARKEAKKRAKKEAKSRAARGGAEEDTYGARKSPAPAPARHYSRDDGDLEHGHHENGRYEREGWYRARSPSGVRSRDYEAPVARLRDVSQQDLYEDRRRNSYSPSASYHGVYNDQEHEFGYESYETKYGGARHREGLYNERKDYPRSPSPPPAGSSRQYRTSGPHHQSVKQPPPGRHHSRSRSPLHTGSSRQYRTSGLHHQAVKQPPPYCTSTTHDQTLKQPTQGRGHSVGPVPRDDARTHAVPRGHGNSMCPGRGDHERARMPEAPQGDPGLGHPSGKTGL